MLSILGLCAPSWAAQPCTTQNYSNPDVTPNWGCPGPDESILVPDINFNPSIGLKVGSVVKGAISGDITLSYPAVLMDKDRVIQLGLKIQGLRRLRWLERHKAGDVVQIEKRYMFDRLSAQLTLEKSRVKEAVEQRNDARKERDKANRWYRSWTCGMVVGIVVTTAAVIGVAYASK